jgi:hypothetical protein
MLTFWEAKIDVAEDETEANEVEFDWQRGAGRVILHKLATASPATLSVESKPCTQHVQLAIADGVMELRTVHAHERGLLRHVGTRVTTALPRSAHGLLQLMQTCWRSDK